MTSQVQLEPTRVVIAEKKVMALLLYRRIVSRRTLAWAV
jgi:hypothetical protein